MGRGSGQPHGGLARAAGKHAVIKLIGLIVNPVAGMGGTVGLKGTDGEMFERAVELGAEPVSPGRVAEFLAHTGSLESEELVAAPGAMGADHLKEAGLAHFVVGKLPGHPTAEDTRIIASAMVDLGVDLIVFAGGDGTARDMADAIGTRIPVVAIPSGVKVYSSVFAYSPRAAAELLDAFVQGADLAEEEVLDIDEKAFREGRVDARHYGYLIVPQDNRLLQGGKESSGIGRMTAEARAALAGAIIDSMSADTLYLLGSGTTMRMLANELGIEKTLLGIDAVVNRQLIERDLNEQGILELLEQYGKAAIVVTPLGGNGFIFGRGNKQFTPAVLRRVGLENILILADRNKLQKLKALHVDTGDPALDDEMTGYIDVYVGPDHRKMMRVK
ncbi:MAG: ATP-NAD kinase family protein [Gammaproteobacteria bacterium]|nr:ATP-NAD kinase family protein [Gammaproteobacteria bacterium]